MNNLAIRTMFCLRIPWHKQRPQWSIPDGSCLGTSYRKSPGLNAVSSFIILLNHYYCRVIYICWNTPSLVEMLTKFDKQVHSQHQSIDQFHHSKESHTDSHLCKSHSLPVHWKNVELLCHYEYLHTSHFGHVIFISLRWMQ